MNKQLHAILEKMSPQQAAGELASAIRHLFSLLDEDERRHMITRMFEDSQRDKVVGMVHL